MIHDLNDRHDVVIAGGGLASLLIAMRLLHQQADLKICIVEKNPKLGGRLGAWDAEALSMRNRYGLQTVSNQLADFVNKTLLLDSEWSGDATELDLLPLNLGILAANKLIQIPDAALFTKKMAAKLGGMATAKNWEDTISAFALLKDDETRLNKAVHKAWSQTKKSGPGLVMDMMAGIVGIPDFWAAPVELVGTRIQQYQAGFIQPEWDKIFRQMLKGLEKFSGFSYLTDCRVVGSHFQDNIWTMETERGSVLSRSLIVCQNPWAAMEWLDVEATPDEVIAFDSKTQPISLVSLWAERADTSDDFAKQMILIPAERTCLYVDNTQICVQAAIPFEMSMDAPNVVKTVKRLKRSKKKFETCFPELKITEKEQLALLPVAWSQSGQALDWRYIKSMRPEALNRKGLMFCGNAYGDTYNHDLNLIRSILMACEAMRRENLEPGAVQDSLLLTKGQQPGQEFHI